MTHVFKKAICNNIFQGWNIIEAFRTIAKLGYDGVEIDPYTIAATVDKISPVERAKICRAAGAAGLEIVGIHNIGKSPEWFLYLNHPDASIRAKTVTYLKALITFCSDLGGKTLVFGGAKRRSVMPEITPQQAWEYTVQGFIELLDTAESTGVIICLEPLSHRLTNFVTKASEAIRMVQEIDHPNFRMMLDVRSASDDERPIPDLIRQSAPYLAHFHTNDDNAGAPGSGNADYARISAALWEVDYGGYLSVELFQFESDPETIARQSLNTLNLYFD